MRCQCGEELGDIVAVVEHGCRPVQFEAESLTPSERSTLLYIEARLVDHHGKLDQRQINHEDRQNLKLFSAAGLAMVDMETVQKFTDEAWDLAGDCRQLRAERDDRVEA